MHLVNHPDTIHLQSDVWEVDPKQLCGGKKVRFAWFSPDCKHFSKAKGGKPVEKKIRGLAWVAVKWAKAVHPDVIMLENVEEFKDWGPIDPETFLPIKEKLGATYRRFVRALVKEGYVVEDRELVASDYNTPTKRKRLFLIARRDGKPIVWPEPTNGPGKKPYRTAAECIDFGIGCRSIFGRKKPLAENTMRRIARGIKKFVVDNPQPFLIPVSHSGDARVNSVHDPLPTVTGSSGPTHALITPHLIGYHSGENSGGQRASLEDPAPTVTTVQGLALVTPHLVGVGGRKGQSQETGIDQPYHTITAKADTAMVAPIVTRIGQTGHGDGGKSKTVDVPLFDHLLEERAPARRALYGAYGERPGQDPRALSVEEPMPTVVPTGNGGSVVAAFLAKHNGGNEATGQKVEQPLDTVTAIDSKAVVTSHLMKMRGTCAHGQKVDQPMPTITAGGFHLAEVRSLLKKFYGKEAGNGIVTIGGEQYQIVDIQMRMLTPRELARAQGFHEEYILDPVVDGKPLTERSQVRMIGNSVCPPLAQALVEANCVGIDAREEMVA